MYNFFLLVALIICGYSHSIIPLYDVSKSFEYNRAHGPCVPLSLELCKAKRSTCIVCGYRVNSPIGIAACPLTTSKGIAAAARLGYDILTYKTIRTSACPVASSKIYFVDVQKQLSHDDVGNCYHAQDTGSFAITNAFGINSLSAQETIKDIVAAREALSAGQLLIVSVYGSGFDRQAQIDDFVAAAQIAYRGGAHIIEANLSCPNLKEKIMVYQDLVLVHDICEAITAAVPEIPLIIKVGIFDNQKQLKEIILAAYNGGARGICGINSVPVHVVDETGNPVYGPNRVASGLSGVPLLQLSLQFVRDAREIITQEKIDFAVLATGGVIAPEQFDMLLTAGADAALSATGAMLNAHLAIDYHKLHAYN